MAGVGGRLTWPVAAAQVPAGTLLDGEVVAWAGDRLDFSLLQQRIAGGPATVARLARQLPASYVAFDVLAHAGVDLRRRPYTERRAVLEDLARTWSPPMTLSPVTTDPDVAAAWMGDYAPAGIEGLVIKSDTGRYQPGRRGWAKLKTRTETDVVLAAVIGPITRPTVAGAGLPIDGELRIVGRTVPLTAIASKELGAQLVPADPANHPCRPAPRPPPSTAGGGTSDPVTLTLVEPIVAEVTADTAWSGRSWRHPLRWVRTRPDLDVDDVTAPPL